MPSAWNPSLQEYRKLLETDLKAPFSLELICRILYILLLMKRHLCLFAMMMLMALPYPANGPQSQQHLQTMAGKLHSFLGLTIWCEKLKDEILVDASLLYGLKLSMGRPILRYRVPLTSVLSKCFSLPPLMDHDADALLDRRGRSIRQGCGRFVCVDVSMAAAKLPPCQMPMRLLIGRRESFLPKTLTSSVQYGSDQFRSRIWIEFRKHMEKNFSRRRAPPLRARAFTVFSDFVYVTGSAHMEGEKK